MNKRVGCLALLTACACGLALGAVDEVKVETGELKGVIKGGVVAFKGIPYAAPPVGENRWRPPLPAPGWNSVRSAAEYGSDCMQLPFPSDAAPLGTKPAEDCLYLNVWAPVERTSAALPVMVWIYGGGFVNGGSSPAVYDGSQFAKRGVVFVSFNYRLGRFGFFGFPALTQEEPAALHGNYGYMDQIAALKWVRDNIGSFGGDPGNVTLFGESAGGGSVLAMLTTPLAKGLFGKAIVESGGGRVGVIAMPRLPAAEQAGILFAKSVGIDGSDSAALAELRKLPAEKIVNGLNMASMFTPTYSGPLIDGKVVVETPQEAFAAGRAAKMPLMAGANSSDIGFSFAKSMDELFAPFGSNREKAKGIYDPQKSGDLKAVGMLVASDQMMVEPARFLVTSMTAAGQPAYEYRFSYVAESMRKEWQGAPHATEIPFVFDTVKARYEEKLTAQDEAIAQAANAYWVAFAKTGDPNGKGRARWPEYKPGKDILLNFTDKGPVAEPDAWKARLDLTQKVAESKHD